jgi:HNH endonuclease
MCHAHHIQHWIDGGPTSLDNLLLLCGHHQRLVHAGPWRVALRPTGQVDFVPPPGVTRQRLTTPRPPRRE